MSGTSGTPQAVSVRSKAMMIGRFIEFPFVGGTGDG
jgi:hypothetical protein